MRAGQERCSGASCRESSLWGAGDPPWAGRGHGALQLHDSNLPCVPGVLSGAGGPPCLACPVNNRRKPQGQFKPVKGSKLIPLHPPCSPSGDAEPPANWDPSARPPSISLPSPSMGTAVPFTRLPASPGTPCCPSRPTSPWGKRRCGSPAAWPHPGPGKRGCSGTLGMDTKAMVQSWPVKGSPLYPPKGT